MKLSLTEAYKQATPALEATRVSKKKRRPRTLDAFGGHRVGWYVHPDTKGQQRRMMPK